MEAKFVNETQNFERGQDPKEALGIGVGNKLRMEGLEALRHFLYHADNDFIDKAWGDSWIVNHLREKLSVKIEEGYMDANALMSFISDLDRGNQEILYNYILKNHVDKW